MILRRFRLFSPNGDSSDPLTFAELMVRVTQRVRKTEGPYEVGEPHDLGPPKKARDALIAFGREMKAGDIGFRGLIHPSVGGDIIAHKIQVKSRELETPGNFLVDHWWSDLNTRYGPQENHGTLACRPIGSGSTPSQHSDWPALGPQIAARAGFPNAASSAGANAIDTFAGTRNGQAEIFEAEVDRCKVGNHYHVQNLIYWPPSSPHPLIWNPEHGLHEYVIPAGGSDHRYHQHADFQPTRTGPTRC